MHERKGLSVGSLNTLCKFVELRHWIPKRPHMNSETKWNGILIHFLLCHWNIYIGCYKSEWQILESTWKPQEIFYSCVIYGNSWWQRKNSEFRANIQYLLTRSGSCYLRLDIYCSADYVNWLPSRTRYKRDKHIFHLACTMISKLLCSKW